MTTFTGNPGQNDTFLGGAAADLFLFNPLDLTGGDVLTGGAGLDILRLTAAGSVNAAALANVTQIEQIDLSGAGNTITVNSAILAANGGVLTVIGNVGGDRIDATQVVNAAYRLDVTAGAGGNDTFLGGAGNDIFRATSTSLSANDSFAGGGGNDTLVIAGGGTLTAPALFGVTGIELLYLGNPTSISLTNGVVNQNAASLTIVGSSGNDTVDASAVSITTRGIAVQAGTGNDVLKGGLGSDIFQFAAAGLTMADSISGGTGAAIDQITLTTAGAVSAANLAGLSGIERYALAAGGNAIAFSDAVMAANGAVATVIGGIGNDSIDASSVATATNRLDASAGGGIDALRGGAGNDILRINATELTAGDVLQGGTGTDTLVIGSAGNVSAAALAGVGGMELLYLNFGNTSVTLNDAVAAANGATLTVFGSSGNDTIDASAVTAANRALAVQAGAGNDMLKGGAGGDSFVFAAAELTAADSVSGGAGAAVDQLSLTTGGAIAATSLTSVTGIERIALSSAGNALALSDAVITANGGVLSVIGLAGNDLIDASGVTGTRRIDAAAGAGTDTLKGGAGDDVLRINTSDLGAADMLQGGGGMDTLAFNGAGAITAANLAGVSGIETLALGAAGTSIAFNDAVAAANAASLGVIGTAGNDTIDASAVTLASRGIAVQAGAGDDLLKGGAGADSFQFAAATLTAADTITGGAGIDQMTLSSAGSVGAAALAGVTGIERIALAAAGTAIALSDAVLAANGSVLAIVGGAGNDSIDASGVATATNRIDATAGSGADTIRGGAGNDLIRIGSGDLASTDVLQGGAGLDTLVIGSAGTIAAAALANVSGIELVSLGATNIALALDNTAATANAATLAIFGTGGNDSVDASAVSLANRAISVQAGSGNDVLKGGAGADIFQFGAADITAADSVSGGGGGSVDQLTLTSTGMIAAASLAGFTGIERIALAAGGNGLTLSDAVIAANGGVLTIVGGAGNDSVDAGGAATATNRVDVAAGAGTDLLRGGAGNDSFRIAAAEISAADTIQGGTGFDTLVIASTGTVAAAALGGVSGMEFLYLNFGGTSVSLNNAVATANGANVTVIGTTGNDTIDASAVTLTNRGLTFQTGAGNDVLKGGAGTDNFQFAIASLTNADSLSGGGGAALDQLSFTTSGTITAASLGGVSGIERIALSAAGSNNISIANALVASAAGTTLAILGTANNDVVNAGAVTGAANKIDVTAGSGNDVLVGGQGTDNFRFAINELSALDNVNGGAGPANDTLSLSGAGAIDFNTVTSVSGIEIVQLDANIHSLTLTNAFVGAAATDSVTVAGGAAADTVDLEDVTDSANHVTTNLGGGADVVRIGSYSAVNMGGDLGAGNDQLTCLAGHNDGVFSGGADYDTYQVVFSGYENHEMGTGTTGFERVNLTGSGNGYSLYFATNNTAGLAVFANSRDAISVALGGGGQSVEGSVLNDTMYGGLGSDTLNGGDGADSLRGEAGADIQNGGNGDDDLTYDAADITITGGAGLDTLVAYFGGSFNLGAADQSLADVAVTTGFEAFDAHEAEVGVSVIGRAGAERILGGTADDTLDGFGGLDTIQGGSGDDAIAYRGTEASIAGTLPSYGVVPGYYFGFDTLVLKVDATVDLGADDQTIGDEVDVESFNGVDASALINGVQVTGNDFENMLVGSQGADALTGLAGNDTIDGGDDQDFIDAGAANDSVVHDDEDSFVDGGTETDTLIVTTAATIDLSAGDQGVGDAGTTINFENADARASTAAVTLIGRADFTSVLIGGSANDTITAGAGGGEFTGGGGADLVTGSDTGSELYYIDAGDWIAGDQILAAAGYDQLRVIASTNLSVGSFSGIEVLSLEAAGLAITLTGAQAASLGQIYAATSQDTVETVIINLVAGSGLTDLSQTGFQYFDHYSGTEGATYRDVVTINGTASADEVSGPGVRHTLNAGAGADIISRGSGYAAGTLVNGEAGNDRIEYGSSDGTILSGGADVDTLFAVNSYHYEVTIDLSASDQTGNDAAIATGFENVDWSGNYYAVAILGSSGANAIAGGQGNDTIDGGLGADSIDSGGGSDQVVFRAGAARIAAGDGTDMLILREAATIDLGDDTADQNAGTGLMSGFESVDARQSAVAVTITGRDDTASTLWGSTSGDHLAAGDYGTYMLGLGGADTMAGGIGGDTFELLLGTDAATGEVIDGGDGHDRLYVDASVDISGISVSNLEELQAGAYSEELDYHDGDVTVTMTGAQAEQFTYLIANYHMSELTTETFIVNVATGTAADLSGLKHNISASTGMTATGWRSTARRERRRSAGRAASTRSTAMAVPIG
jgi:Ca2+-binding RTX toxin-like protein